MVMARWLAAAASPSPPCSPSRFLPAPPPLLSVVASVPFTTLTLAGSQDQAVPHEATDVFQRVVLTGLTTNSSLKSGNSRQPVGCGGGSVCATGTSNSLVAAQARRVPGVEVWGRGSGVSIVLVTVQGLLCKDARVAYVLALTSTQ